MDANRMRIAVVLMLVSGALSAEELKLDMESPASIQRAGAALKGDVGFVEGREGKGASFVAGGRVEFPTGGALTARQGTVQMWVKPAWAGSHPGRHTLFHMGGSDAHVTLFATGGKLLFVYKANARAWYATTADVSGWRQETWHRIHASWRPASGKAIVCLLDVDGRLSAGSGATILSSLPPLVTIGARGKRELANAVIDEVLLSPKCILPTLPPPKAKTLSVSVDAAGPTGAMPRTWSFVTPWNSRTYRIPFTQSHPYFRRFKEAGFDMVRMVAFSENWLWGTAVTRGRDGKLKLDFSDFDAMVDIYRAAGSEPYIRLAYHMPSVMSSARGELSARSYSPPRDMAEWCDFMERIVRHCNVERKLGIRYWVAMLNEADQPIRRGLARWDSVLELYEKTARTVKRVAPDAKIGGPATCGPLPGRQEEDIKRFVRFCRDRDLAPDFICFHQYARPHPRDYERATLAAKRAVESAWPGLKCEYFLDEWSLWAKDKTQENEYAAAYLAAAIHYQIRAGLTRSSIVSFNTAFAPEEAEGIGKTFDGPFRRTPGQGARFYAAEKALAGRTLRCLYTHSPAPRRSLEEAYTFGRYKLRVAAGSVLHVATALGIDHEDADGVNMKVLVRDGDKQNVLLSEHVRKTAWRNHALSLAAFAGREVTVEFRTNCGGPGASSLADHGLWGDPHVQAGGHRVFDFCKQVGEAATGWFAPRQWHQLRTRLPMIKGNVITPVYFTYWLYNRLRGQRLPVTLAGRDGIHDSDVAGALACQDGKAVRVLLWHFDAKRAALSQHLDMDGVDVTRTVKLRVAGLPAHCRLRRYLIDRNHSNAYTDYVLKGKSSGGGGYNLKAGKVEVVEDGRRDTDNGCLELSVPLRNLSVSLLEIVGP